MFYIVSVNFLLEYDIHKEEYTSTQFNEFVLSKHTHETTSWIKKLNITNTQESFVFFLSHFPKVTLNMRD